MNTRNSAHLWLWLALGLLFTLAGALLVQNRMVDACRGDFTRDCDALDEAVQRQADQAADEFRIALRHVEGPGSTSQLGSEIALGLRTMRSLWAVAPDGSADWLWQTTEPDNRAQPGPSVIDRAMRSPPTGAPTVLVDTDGSAARVWLAGHAGRRPVLARIDLEEMLRQIGGRASAVATGEIWLSVAGRTLALRVAGPEADADPVLWEQRELTLFGGEVTLAYQLRGLATSWSRLRSLVTIAVIALGGLATLLGFFLLRALRAAAERENRLRVLTDDLHRRDRDIQRQRDHAQAASAAKSALLRRTSHNMRSPLSTIVGLTDALLARTSASASRRQLATVRASAQHMLDLANELLDLARAESTGISTAARDVAPDALLREVLAAFADRADIKDLRLDLRWRGRPPASVRTDPIRLREVLINLLDNAVRHTHAGSVVIEACAEPRPGTLTIQVVDTGEGISAERIPALARADDANPTASPGRGTHGMGLAITRHLVNALGGAMEIRSRIGVGSTVTVRIPAAPMQTGARHEAPAGAVTPRPPAGRVLLVDDAPEVREFMRAALAEAGIEADTVPDAEQALSAVRARAYDLTLLDLHLGDTDGAGLLADLRAAQPGLPVVAFSGDVDPESRRRCLEAGFAAFLPKPFTREELERIIDYHLADRPGRRAA